MRRESFTLIFIPLGKRSPKQLFLSFWKLACCILLALGVGAMLIGGFVRAGYFRERAEQADARRAATVSQLEGERAENSSLAERIRLLEEEKAAVEARISELRRSADEERAALTDAFRDETDALIRRLEELEAEENELRDELELEDAPGVGGAGEKVPDTPAGSVAETLAYIDGFLADCEAGLREIRGAVDEQKLLDSFVPSGYPLKRVSYITSSYGVRRNPITHVGYEFHHGLDLSASSGNEILAAGAGVVSFAGWDSVCGNLVIIDHGNGYTSQYSHCSRLYVSAGDEAGRGDTIALVGSTGRSTGAHLDFRVTLNGEFINPTTVLEAYK